MKASVMTLSLSNNYGATLQAYALVRKMNNLGIDTVAYKYIDKKRLTYGLTFKQKIYYFLWNFFKNTITLNKRNRLFKKFRKKNIPYTTKRYHNNKELCKNPGEYDVYLSGSDQIWNPDLFLYDLSYFLNFVPKGKKKVAYASSFGKSSFQSKYAETCGALLKDFSHIAVREESGINIVKELSGQDAECVLDPTLLLTAEEWEIVTEKAKKKAKKFNGILCYIMPGKKSVVDKIKETAEKLSKEKGLPIKYIGIKEYQIFKYGIKNCDIFVSPEDFVCYFKNASCVVTNSFHGTAFSLTFNKDFYVPIDGKIANGVALHERVLSILSKTGAENALVPVDEDINLKELNKKEVQEKLSKERTLSLEYLKKSIGV
ncbi:MAG: polysaccharide pyruvyl transferase family protein [Clostridiales bacterium]|nr:polysaccharide pyruvyl transferase family protein [Clostridiales bacterium]